MNLVSSWLASKVVYRSASFTWFCWVLFGFFSFLFYLKPKRLMFLLFIFYLFNFFFTKKKKILLLVTEILVCVFVCVFFPAFPPSPFTEGDSRLHFPARISGRRETEFSLCFPVLPLPRESRCLQTNSSSGTITGNSPKS